MKKEKEITKSDITTTDAVYIIFTIVLAFCFIAIAVTGILLFISSIMAMTQAASLDAPTGKIVILALIVIVVVALFAYLDVIIFKTVFKTLKNYIKERKEALEKINSKAPNNQSNNQ